MVATALIQRPPGCWIGNAGQPDSAVSLLFFDATLKESHKGKNTITRQPVEQGVDITDNVRPEPDELSLDAIITNSPLTFNGVTFPDSANYASDAYRQLLSLKNNATFLSVSTSLRDYDNMIISSLDVDRDKTTGQVLAVKISFQSVIIVSSQQQPVPVKVSGSAQTQAGTVTPTDATPAQAQSISLASKITGIGEVANP